MQRILQFFRLLSPTASDGEFLPNLMFCVIRHLNEEFAAHSQVSGKVDVDFTFKLTLKSILMEGLSEEGGGEGAGGC